MLLVEVALMLPLYLHACSAAAGSVWWPHAAAAVPCRREGVCPCSL